MFIYIESMENDEHVECIYAYIMLKLRATKRKQDYSVIKYQHEMFIAS